VNCKRILMSVLFNCLFQCQLHWVWAYKQIFVQCFDWLDMTESNWIRTDRLCYWLEIWSTFYCVMSLFFYCNCLVFVYHPTHSTLLLPRTTIDNANPFLFSCVCSLVDIVGIITVIIVINLLEIVSLVLFVSYIIRSFLRPRYMYVNVLSKLFFLFFLFSHVTRYVLEFSVVLLRLVTIQCGFGEV